MSITLYFLKVNINSHIFNVYENKDEFDRIIKLLYNSIKDDIEYKREEKRMDEDGDVHPYEASYKFNSIEKYEGELNYTITGNIVKKTQIYIKEIDEHTGIIRKRPVDNSEVVRFHFDLHKEIVAFHRTNRFGFSDFNLAFKYLLNNSVQGLNEEYHFEVSLLKQGLDVQEIKKQLKEIGDLETLKIEIIPPNPDDELLDNIQENGEEYLTSIKAGNVTQTSILFTSKAPQGLNLESGIIKNELEKIDKIHSKLSSEEATRKGYVNVEASNKNGRSFTTKDSNPVKVRLDDRPQSLYDFAVACKKKISTLISSLL